MWKPLLMLMTLGAGCVSVQSAAVCDGTASARTAHAEALVADGGDASVATGARLIALIDAACP